MRKNGIVILGIIAAFSLVILFQLQTAAGLRRELAASTEENARLSRNLAAQEQDSSSSSLGAGSNSDEKPGESQLKRLQELESEVMRLRGVSSRALSAEAEVAQLKSTLASNQVSTAAAAPDANSNSNAFLAYLGEAVAPPSNIDPAYTREGLLNAVQQAAQLAGVSLKKVEMETSEFPFLAGVVCDSDADFEKLKAQFKNMQGYEYGGASSSHGIYAFNIIPHRSYPSETGQRIGRRTMLRMQMFFDQLSTR
jgi:hypothetical protein